MPHVTVELFKAFFVIALAACGASIVRVLASSAPPRVRTLLAAFLTVFLIPLTWLYLSLAFPSAARVLLPLQQVMIWLYGPALLGFMQALLHERDARVNRVAQLLLVAAVIELCVRLMGSSIPAAWEVVVLCQALLVASYCVSWAVRRRAQLRIVASAYVATSFYWLLFLSIGLWALLLLDLTIHLVQYVGLTVPATLFYSLTATCAAYVCVVAVALLWRTQPELAVAADHEPVAIPETPTAISPRKLELSSAAAAELTSALDRLVSERRIHTRNDLTLADLARELGVSTHLTSELLNAHLQTSFYEFMNMKRVDEAARLLRSPAQRLSVAEVAYEAGFNNPNTFYREFKRRFGVTPAQFRREQGKGTPLRMPAAELTLDQK